MQVVRLLSSSTLIAGALVSFSARGEEPVFRPETGSTLEKSFETRVQLELDLLELALDGQDLGAMLGNFEFSIETAVGVSVSDQYHGVADGRPSKLTRTFDEIGGDVAVEFSTDFGSESSDIESTSELEGETVVFTWDDERGEYDVAYAQGEGDAELLEGLDEDMDLRVFLPPGEVSEDATWSVELEDLGRLAIPGGNLALQPEDMDQDEVDVDVDAIEEILSQEYDDLGSLFDGECACKFNGTREVGGERLAEIEVRIEGNASVDFADSLEQIIEALAAELGDEGPDLAIQDATIDLGFEGEGVLSWNLDAGRMSSFYLNGELDLSVELAVSGSAEGQSMSAEVAVDMSGTYSQKVEAAE